MSASEEQPLKQQELLDAVSAHLAQKYGKRRRVFSLLGALSVAVVFISLGVVLVSYDKESKHRKSVELALNLEKNKRLERFDIASNDARSALFDADTTSTLSHINGFLNIDPQTRAQDELRERIEEQGELRALQHTASAQRLKIKRQHQEIAKRSDTINSLVARLRATINHLNYLQDSLQTYAVSYNRLQERVKLDSLKSRVQVASLVQQQMSYKQKAFFYDSLVNVLGQKKIDRAIMGSVPKKSNGRIQAMK
jgi:hypothetical protein